MPGPSHAPRLRFLVLIVSAIWCTSLLSAGQIYNVGLNFLDTTTEIPELPFAVFEDGEWTYDISFDPVQITSPTSYAVSDGGLVGWNEADVRKALRFQVEEAYRAVTSGMEGQTLNINFFLGPVPQSAPGRSLNVVLGSNDLSANLYGFTQTGAFFNETTYPDHAYAAAVFLNTLDSIGGEPGIELSTPEAAFNNLAGTIAHEVGHLFDLEHVPAGDQEPYALMALGATGLDSAKRLTKRAFSAESIQQLSTAVPTSNVADFNLDGDVDVFQFDGGGDAQVILRNLGLATGASHSQGDANSDGDVDVFQLDGEGDAQIFLANLGTDVVPGTAEVTYNRSTGDITINIGAGIGVLGFEFGPDIDLASLPALGSLPAAQADDRVLAYFDPTGLSPGTYELGSILPLGLSANDIAFAYSPLGAASVLGALQLVPEPGTIWLAAAAVLGRVLVRR